MLNRLKRGIKRLAKSVNDTVEAGINTYGEIKKIKLDMLKSVGSSIKSSCSNVNKTKAGIFMIYAGVGIGIGLSCISLGIGGGLIAADKIK